MKKVCFVIPCYNEELNVEELYNELVKTTAGIENYIWEFLFADNYSTDGTEDKLRALAAKDKRVKVILNQANYGPSRSSANAMYSVNADAAIIMAADLEDPPEMIYKFLEAWEDGYKVVFAQYRKRKENFLIHVCRKIYYNITVGLSDFKTEKNLTGFGLLDKSVLKIMKSVHEPEPNIVYLTAELGYKIKYIPFDKPKRGGGKSSYSITRYYRTAMENLVKCSQTPLHVVCTFGAVLSLGSLIIAFIYLIRKLLNWDAFNLGIAPLVIGLFFLGGVLLFSIGIVGEYLGNALKRLTIRPYVIERERINFEDEMSEKPREEE